jgi:hypothetical protein
MSRFLYPQGGIRNGDMVYVLTYVQSTLYGLTLVNGVYVMTPVFTVPGVTLNPVVAAGLVSFNISQFADAYKFFATGSVNGISISGSNVIQHGIPTGFYLNQSNYTELGGANILLSTAQYVPSYGAVGVSSPFDGVSSSFDGVSSPFDGFTIYTPLSIVPVTVFLSGGVRLAGTTNLLMLMQIVYANFVTTATQIPAWTTVADARLGISFNYCVAGTSCNGTCKSTCFSNTTDCGYSNMSSSFVCQNINGDRVVIEESGLLAPTPTRTVTPLEAIIIAIVIIIVILVLLYFLVY